jgi:hypothetical protein
MAGAPAGHALKRGGTGGAFPPRPNDPGGQALPWWQACYSVALNGGLCWCALGRPSCQGRMMRRRQWIAIVAMVSVLLHAAALVRHHGVMLGAHLQYQALVADLTASCHGEVDASKASADLPHVPKPIDAQSGCPICSGQAPSFAIISRDALVAPARLRTRPSWGVLRPLPISGPHAVCPPARGPPISI